MDGRTNTFHRMMEIIELSSVPTLGGWTRKVSELEQHISRGGIINEAGSFLVQSGRKTDGRLDWALSMLSCLPKRDDRAALLIAHYCGPHMLEDFPLIIYLVERQGVKKAGAGWSWPHRQSSIVGGHVGNFWSRVADLRLLRHMRNQTFHKKMIA